MDRSRLVLGTVQLGMQYGLNNSSGQPDREGSFAILDAAVAAGIDTLDTAWAYGTAEDVIGEWIAKRKLEGTVKVISKMKPHVLDAYASGTASADIVQKEVEKSLQRLTLKNLDGYLLHTPEYMYSEGVVEGLGRVKDAGSVKHVGVSIYDETDALYALDIGMEYIQVPYNALDQRLDKTDFFSRAKAQSVTVFARSPFLQGLLLMQPDSIPPHLSYARPHVERFLEIIHRYDLSPLEASLMFVYHHCRAERIVFGVDTRTQLKDNLAIVERLASSSDTGWVNEIADAFQNIDKSVVSPSLWSKA